MIISKLRIERKDGFSYLVADIQAIYTKNNRLWFSVPTSFEHYFTDDVYDAFMVAALYPAMYYNESIEIKGKVSPRLYYNLTHYMPSIVRAYRKEMKYVDIKVEGFAIARQDSKGVATGFSAGVDSFTTIIDHFVKENNPDYKITSLFFFNVGSHGGGGEKARRMFLERFNRLKSFPDRVDLPYIPVDSNLFDFYLDYWEYDAGLFCRACAILLFQRAISKYYISSDYAYNEVMYTAFDNYVISLSGIVETFANPLLSTENLEMITDGSQYSRTEKTELIVQYPLVKEYLNVCVSDTENCSICGKCLRTLICLESMGLLDEYKNVFDIEKYKRKAYEYKCRIRYRINDDNYNKDNVQFAESHGVRIPPYWEACLYLAYLKIKNSFKKRN